MIKVGEAWKGFVKDAEKEGLRDKGGQTEVHILKHISLPLQLFSNASEEISQVFMGHFPVQGCKNCVKLALGSQKVIENLSNLYERLFKQAN